MKSKSLFRRHLALTTILTVAPFLGYGRQAVAACDPTGPSTFLCSGDSSVNNATIAIAADNAAVATAPGFAVNAPAGNGITISGDGDISFTDIHASTIEAEWNGLEVSSGQYYPRTDGSLTIVTNSDITGGYHGILATNLGRGEMAITVDGQVTGSGATGIQAVSHDGKMTITTGANSEVTGGGGGIRARKEGTGDIDIIVDGKVSGVDHEGISVRNGTSSGGIKIATGAGSEIKGKSNGIVAENLGAGDLLITAAGRVTGQTGTALRAVNSDTGNNLTIITAVGSEIVAEMDADYNGGNGITAWNEGRGSVDITVNGDVTSEHYHGIYAYNSANGTDMKITVGAESSVYGNFFGIEALNNGVGDLDITVLGEVSSPNNAVVAFNWGDESVNLKLRTGTGSVITGWYRGIMAKNYGVGDLEVTAYGVATGEYGRGIYAYNMGKGDTRIIIGSTGLAQGGDGGIYASSSHGQAISITNNGTVRNLSGASDDLAIETDSGPATIDNNGRLIGTVRLLDERYDYDDTLTNAGIWNTAGGFNDTNNNVDRSSNFGTGNDVVNNSGTLIAADDGEDFEKTELSNLETLNNSGLITLADGQAGDELLMGSPDGLEFASQGGRLAVDAILTENGASDRLIIDGNVSGVTTVLVKAIGEVRPNTEGIAVIEVLGDAEDGNFKLAGGKLNTGFFAWDMRLDDSEGNIFELYTSGLGAGAYEFAGGLTATQDIWFQSVGTLLQRQADLRATIAGTQVTPVADFSEPVAPTAAGSAMPGFWFKALGAYLERDAEENGITLDRRQTVFGGLAGLDIGVDLEDPGETVLFGIFGGYLTSDLKFKATDTKWDFEGPSLGAYATYLNQAFYADLTVKADFLSIDIDADDLAPGSGKADTNGFNIGGQVDAGYKIGLEHGIFVEPQASLAVLHTEIDDVDDILGGAVDFDDETSVRGRLGARLGHEFTDSNALIYASDVTASVWQEFNGSNGATIFAPDFATAGVSDDTIGTFGDVSVGFSVASPEGWSSFLRGSWQFAEDFDALSASAGLRYAW